MTDVESLLIFLQIRVCIAARWDWRELPMFRRLRRRKGAAADDEGTRGRNKMKDHET
jgi:hypothetical protein